MYATVDDFWKIESVLKLTQEMREKLNCMKPDLISAPEGKLFLLKAISASIKNGLIISFVTPLGWI